MDKRVLLGFHLSSPYTSIVVLNVRDRGTSYLTSIYSEVPEVYFEATHSIFASIEDIGVELCLSKLAEACRMHAYMCMSTDTLHNPENVGVLKVALTFLDWLLRKKIKGSTQDSWIPAIQELKEYTVELKRYHDKVEVWMEKSMKLLDELILQEAEKLRRIACAKKIQRVWRDVITNPYHECCKRRLMHELGNMTNLGFI